MDNKLHIKPNQAVLVLNSSYEPINITSWKRAVLLILKNKAHMISDKVIRLINYVRIPHSKLMSNRPTRALIYKRDDNRCQYCGSIKNLTIDHIVPKSRGGQDTWENMVVACGPCNTKKGDTPLEKTGLVLYKRPKAPYNKMHFQLHKSGVEEWKQYAFS